MTAPLALLTASRMRSFRACARQHLHQYVQGYRPVRDADALTFGTAMHELLERWWLGDRDIPALLRTIPGELDPFARMRLGAMLVGYDARWRDEPWETLAVEKEFTLPLINPTTGASSRTWQLAGKVDAIARAPDGRVWVIEHKTSSEDCSPGSAYRRRLALDGQVSQYIEGANALGYDVAGVLYDVLCKPAQRPLAATAEDKRIPLKADPTRLRKGQREADETPRAYFDRLCDAITTDPARYYHRVEVVRLEDEREEYAFDVWQLGELMRESERTGRAPRNPDACDRYGAKCAFFSVCTGQASLDDPALFHRTGPAPELPSTLTPAA